MTDKSFTFDWHDDETTSEFLRYMWVSLMSGGDFEDLMKRTDKGHSVTLQVFANGAEVNAAALMESLEANFDHCVNKRAGELASSIGLTELTEKVAQIENKIKAEVKSKFEAIGITVEEEEW